MAGATLQGSRSRAAGLRGGPAPDSGQSGRRRRRISRAAPARALAGAGGDQARRQSARGSRFEGIDGDPAKPDAWSDRRFQGNRSGRGGRGGGFGGGPGGRGGGGRRRKNIIRPGSMVSRNWISKSSTATIRSIFSCCAIASNTSCADSTSRIETPDDTSSFLPFSSVIDQLGDAAICDAGEIGRRQGRPNFCSLKQASTTRAKMRRPSWKRATPRP